MKTEFRDEGFTLVEVLVVMIIIGTLAGMAIPSFMQQRQRAVDKAMLSDLRSIATAEEAHMVSTGSYLAVADVANTPALGITLSRDNTGSVVLDPGGRSGTYCVVVGRVPTAAAGVAPTRLYISDRGGVQPPTVQACA